ncbi:MAG TPA: TOBE-like domain-containing protein [Polyangia bacterium]
MSVTVSGLTKRFAAGAAPAVAGVGFRAPTGAVTSLLGPSGAGKSTVLRLIAGLEHPDAGAIRVDDRDVTALPVQRRTIGFVFQGYALFQNLTVRRNVAFGLEVRKAPRAEIRDRVDELLRLVQLEDLGDRFPSQLSGGQRQRVAFARALAPRPGVLLLDEPFGALDARVRVELRAWLQRLHEETHVTTVLVTHDQDEALELSQHVVVMLDGRVAQAGAPHEIYDHPATPFVARFVGGANVLRGRVAADEEARFAPAPVPAGAAVHTLVRPHEVKLAKAPEGCCGASLARIQYVRRVGSYVKVSVALPSGEPLEVEMSLPELKALGVREGDAVTVDLRAATLLVADDYVI